MEFREIDLKERSIRQNGLVDVYCLVYEKEV